MMEKKIKRLLFSAEPYFDESFVGYITRLAEMNDIPDIRWIFSEVGCAYNNSYRFSLDLKVDLTSLSILTGVPKERLQKLLYTREYGNSRRVVGNIMVFGHPLLQSFVTRENPKICEECLKDHAYRRKIWEVSAITVCPAHRCLLMDECPACNQKLEWVYSAIDSCRCGYDFRMHRPVPRPQKELRIANHLYRVFMLLPAKEDATFPEHLMHLSPSNVLNVLTFIAGHFAGIRNPLGRNMFKSRTNREIHGFLNRAMGVFDHWPQGFYAFIAEWIKEPKSIFVNCNMVDASRVRRLPLSYGAYELLNQVIKGHFRDEQFKFLWKAFDDYLETKPPLGNSFEDCLFRY